MSALAAVLYREGKIRVTNVTFIFWDLFYPISYLLIFGVGINHALGTPLSAAGVDYNSFFLAKSPRIPPGRSFSTATTAFSLRCSRIRSVAPNTCWEKCCST
jgi:hypothetical protein